MTGAAATVRAREEETPPSTGSRASLQHLRRETPISRLISNMVAPRRAKGQRYQ